MTAGWFGGQTPPEGIDAAAAQQQPTEQQPAAASDETGFVSARPILMVGAAGDDVAELGFLLAGHGFPNAVSTGQADAPPILDDALMRAVVAFQAANGINPTAPEGDGSAGYNAAQTEIGVVDARTWEALLGYQHKVTPVGAQA